MKIVCSQDELLAKLQIAARGVSQRSTVQILSGLLVRASADGAELSATDMELSLRVPLEARVEEPGDVVLPGRLLLDIVRALPAATSPSPSRGARAPLSSSCGPSRYPLNTQSAEDFPQLPDARRRVFSGRPRGIRRHGQPCRPRGVQGRVATGADRRAGRAGRRHRDHGRHRQLPAVGEGVARCRAPPASRRRSCRRERWARWRASPPATSSRSRSARTRCCSGMDGVGCRRAGSTASSPTTASCCPRPSSTRSRSPRTSCWT